MQSGGMKLSPPIGLPDALITFGFAVLFVANIAHHAMWSDELLAWMIARTADGPAGLFGALHYDGHPGLWHALLWPVTRVTGDPRAMQVVHGAIGLMLIGLIGLCSPFSRGERALLMGGYFLAFEYTVLSRNYGIGLLLALLYARQRARGTVLGGAVLLGLLANTHLYAAILSAVLALELADARLREGWTVPRLLHGALVYVAAVGLAVVTVWPAADISGEQTHLLADVASLGHLLKTVVRFVAIGLAPVRAEPLAWNFLLFVPERSGVVDLWPYLAATAGLLAMVAAALRDRPRLLAVFLVTSLGAALFGHLVYAVAVRHWGIVFTALVTCLWMARANGGARSRLVAVLLVIGAIGGVQAQVLQWDRPFSMAEATARWIAGSDVRDRALIGFDDTHTPAVAAFLGRPMAMPECDCVAARASFNRARDGFRRDTLPAALDRLLGAEALLVASTVFGAEEIGRIGALGMTLTLLHAETGGWTSESFWVYGLTRQP